MKIVVFKYYRTFLVFSMLILLPASGVLWTLAESKVALALAILLSGLGVISVVAEESVSAAVDSELDRLQKDAADQDEKIRNLTEALREADRMLAMLEEQNSRVSAELVARSANSEAA